MFCDAYRNISPPFIFVRNTQVHFKNYYANSAAAHLQCLGEFLKRETFFVCIPS